MLSRWLESGRQQARLHRRRTAMIVFAFFVLSALDGRYGVLFRDVWVNGMMPAWVCATQ